MEKHKPGKSESQKVMGFDSIWDYDFSEFVRFLYVFTFDHNVVLKHNWEVKSAVLICMREFTNDLQAQ